MIYSDKTLNSQFPKTRYQGSKRKILPWIYESIGGLEFETVLDGMGGSGMVSYMFKKIGKRVAYNDKLKFNYWIGKALIQNSKVKLSQKKVDWILKRNEEINYKSIIQDNFNDMYFLKEENEFLDIIINNIINMKGSSSTLDYEKAIAYYALFQTCLIKRPFNLFHRNNLYIRTNDVKRTFGNSKTWERPIEHYFNNFVKEINSFIFDNGSKCRAINKSVFDIKKRYDLVYLDPPYFRHGSTNETSNYLKCYHFLEGITEYEDWPDKIDFESSNYRLKNINESNDFTKSISGDSFKELLSKFGESKIVISYKSGGTPSIEFLADFMSDIGKNVQVKEKKYTYALNKQNGNARYNREVLIIGND